MSRAETEALAGEILDMTSAQAAERLRGIPEADRQRIIRLAVDRFEDQAVADGRVIEVDATRWAARPSAPRLAVAEGRVCGAAV